MVKNVMMQICFIIITTLLLPAVSYSSSNCSKSLSTAHVIPFIPKKVARMSQTIKKIKFKFKIPGSVWFMNVNWKIEDLFEDNNIFELPPQIDQKLFITMLKVYRIETIGDMRRVSNTNMLNGKRTYPFSVEMSITTEHDSAISRFIDFWYNDLLEEDRKVFAEAFAVEMNE